MLGAFQEVCETLVLKYTFFAGALWSLTVQDLCARWRLSLMAKQDAYMLKDSSPRTRREPRSYPHKGDRNPCRSQSPIPVHKALLTEAMFATVARLGQSAHLPFAKVIFPESAPLLTFCRDGSLHRSPPSWVVKRSCHQKTFQARCPSPGA